MPTEWGITWLGISALIFGSVIIVYLSIKFHINIYRYMWRKLKAEKNDWKFWAKVVIGLTIGILLGIYG